MNEDCIFCKIASGQFGTEFLYESDEIVAFRDIHPRAPIHFLVIPKKHIPKVSDVQPEDEALIGKMVAVANIVAKQEKISESGYRLVFNCGRDSGQDVFHIHLHVLGGRKLNWPPG
ncbi:MAG: histidine triad nucleotide-binding protein [Candidatus Marinimicrobia bacterium CG08_land_8_20_14_0_20_45_22]|nr:MAG: histidine triad nucleotide-binding protein [Candidatus Marinimicrobia bacterium CG08_land_8_20_14_0_20_45_22]